MQRHLMQGLLVGALTLFLLASCTADDLPSTGPGSDYWYGGDSGSGDWYGGGTVPIDGGTPVPGNGYGGDSGSGDWYGGGTVPIDGGTPVPGDGYGGTPGPGDGYGGDSGSGHWHGSVLPPYDGGSSGSSDGDSFAEDPRMYAPHLKPCIDSVRPEVS
jgi:hypothetical protein